ncbi:MAG: DNA-directed RNA polymerase subunit E'' [Candidatus Thermoplasmatota archaeon]|jgi:DNA-directed RNA polymerase subunit E"|nr:DNA-directed RNA polymerase subunit E'' [Candidatus Thermoplasmatota archaeon]MCL5791142.1 DNA-directed RNA polymerase subunit E'' [Candidatus Thermoplasmatota archaeon]
MSVKSTKKKYMACKTCKRIYLDQPCPDHGDSHMTDDWYGFLIIVDPVNSQIARRAGITTEGTYAIKVRQ